MAEDNLTYLQIYWNNFRVINYLFIYYIIIIIIYSPILLVDFARFFEREREEKIFFPL